MRKLILAAAVCCAGVIWVSCAYAQAIEGKLNVTISEDRANLEIVYEVKNLTGAMIAPNPADTYHITIRNVDTGVEVFNGNLDSAFQKDVSQYASPYAHAIFAVKRIPIPARMKANPGFYLIFLSTGYNALGEENVFYIPANLSNPNPIIRQISKTVSQIKNILNTIFGSK